MKKIRTFIAMLGLASLPMAWAAPQPDVLPLSTNSAQVRRLLDQAWVLDSDQGEQAKAIDVLRKVVKIEPEFAMGHEMLAQISLDPAEQVREQNQAFANRGHANASEQIVIEWFQDAADHKLIPAITNMNEVLHKYPHDRWLVFLANSWLMQQTQYERAAAVFENSGLADSPGLINSAAYTYANMRHFSKAFSLMDKFVALMPNDPNPQDSYAEILRMAGYYTVAIDHYRVALSINPQFYSSQFGIADTYLLIGNEERARREYETAFQKFPSLGELDRIQWRTREATTYIYEGNLPAADKAMQAIVDYAHTRHMSQVEAETYRQMAMYQPEKRRGMELLRKAESAVREGNNVSAMNAEQEAAQVLRTRVEIAIKAGDSLAADSAIAKLAQLALNSDDKIIDGAFNGALGAHLCYEAKYKEAIPHLEEDGNSPLSLERLANAYRMTGYFSGARHIEQVLARLNTPSVEQALVVPAFRKCLQNPTCNVSVKDAAMETKH
ncbi:MAG: tetratricopeptide repeat protein [Terriglobales bacterium]